MWKKISSNKQWDPIDSSWLNQMWTIFALICHAMSPLLLKDTEWIKTKRYSDNVKGNFLFLYNPNN